jgi:hypothetical protein
MINYHIIPILQQLHPLNQLTCSRFTCCVSLCLPKNLDLLLRMFTAKDSVHPMRRRRRLSYLEIHLMPLLHLLLPRLSPQQMWSMKHLSPKLLRIATALDQSLSVPGLIPLRSPTMAAADNRSRLLKCVMSFGRALIGEFSGHPCCAMISA